MKPLTMQPTFTMDVPLPADDLMPKIRQAIREPALREHVASAGLCIDVHVDTQQRRFWSPHLNVQVSESEAGSHLFCRFSPRPEVWTMVMFLYFVAAFLICCAAIYGYVQWFLGQPPWSLAVIPLASLVIVALHVASLIGQRLSADQMVDLRQHLDQTLDRALSIPGGGFQPPLPS
jgi:hypothetical protein